MIRSLRMRLFLGVTVVSALVLGGLAAAIEEDVRHTLKGEFDRELMERARTLASMVEQTGSVVHFDFPAAQFPEFEPGPHAAYFEVLLDGAAFRRSASLGNGNLSTAATRDAQPEWIALPDGRRGRILAMPFTPLPDNPETAPPTTNQPVHAGMLIVAQDSADLDRTITRLIVLTAALCAAATLLSGGSWWRWRGGRSARSKNWRATSPRCAKPSSRRAFPPPACPRNSCRWSIGSMICCSGWIRRSDGSGPLRRMWRMNCRAPGGAAGDAGGGGRRPRDAAAYEGAIDKSLAILAQMQGLVENLLLLARAESGQLKVRRGVVDLEALLQECRLALERPAAARRLAMVITGEGDAAGDQEFVRIVFNNLLDNAVNYADTGTTSEIRVLPAQPGLAVEISNQGHALSAADLPRLFERFMRKDAARSATGIHAGLGLSISRQLAELQDARIVLRLEGPRFVRAGGNARGGEVGKSATE